MKYILLVAYHGDRAGISPLYTHISKSHIQEAVDGNVRIYAQSSSHSVWQIALFVKGLHASFDNRCTHFHTDYS